MRVKSFFGFGICLRRVTSGMMFSNVLLTWRIEIDFAVWHWRINLRRQS